MTNTNTEETVKMQNDDSNEETIAARPPHYSTLMEIGLEVERARQKFPANIHLLAALTEEVGELAEALLQDQGSDRVRAEAVQVACVAIRIIEEGDGDFACAPELVALREFYKRAISARRTAQDAASFVRAFDKIEGASS